VTLMLPVMNNKPSRTAERVMRASREPLPSCHDCGAQAPYRHLYEVERKDGAVPAKLHSGDIYDGAKPVSFKRNI
jgi:hypothetical protein